MQQVVVQLWYLSSVALVSNKEFKITVSKEERAALTREKTSLVKGGFLKSLF